MRKMRIWDFSRQIWLAVKTNVVISQHNSLFCELSSLMRYSATFHYVSLKIAINVENLIILMMNFSFFLIILFFGNDSYFKFFIFPHNIILWKWFLFQRQIHHKSLKTELISLNLIKLYLHFLKNVEQTLIQYHRKPKWLNLGTQLYISLRA